MMTANWGTVLWGGQRIIILRLRCRVRHREIAYSARRVSDNGRRWEQGLPRSNLARLSVKGHLKKAIQPAVVIGGAG